MNNLGTVIGQIVVAILALGIVGYLVMSESGEKIKPPTNPPVQGESKGTSELPVVEKKLILSNSDGATFNWNELSDENKKSLIIKIEHSQMMDKFILTSKSGPPPGANLKFFLEMDGNKINLSRLNDEEWNELKLKTLKIEGGTTTKLEFIHSTKAPPPDVIIESVLPNKGQTQENTAPNSEK